MRKPDKNRGWMLKTICGSIRISNIEEFLTRLQHIARTHNAVIQAVNADLIAGMQHITFAAGKAIKAFNEHNNTSHNIAMETLLHIAATRQIEKALRFGIKTGHNNLALLLLTQENQQEEELERDVRKLIHEDPGVVDYTPSKKEGITTAFNITQEELSAVGEDKIPQLVCERVALASLEK